MPCKAAFYLVSINSLIVYDGTRFIAWWIGLSESIPTTTVIVFFTGSMTIKYTAASISEVRDGPLAKKEVRDGQSRFIETFVKLEKPQSCCGLPLMQLLCLTVHMCSSLSSLTVWQMFSSDRDGNGLVTGPVAKPRDTALAAAEDACFCACAHGVPRWPAGCLPQGWEGVLCSLARPAGTPTGTNESLHRTRFFPTDARGWHPSASPPLGPFLAIRFPAVLAHPGHAWCLVQSCCL
jgi:hypothetical protein